jgi:hypothetical protein
MLRDDRALPYTAAMPEHPLRTVKPASDTDGAAYDYRGAVILSNKQGTNLTFSLEGFPHGPKGRWGGGAG